MTNPFISVIVPAYNEEVLIANCLNSLKNQTLDSSQYEVIIVNNASTDQTAEIAEAKGARVVNEDQKGYVHALIAGTKAARGEIFAFTDADTKVPSDWLEKILTNFRRDTDLYAYGGVYEFYDGPTLVRKVAQLLRFLLKDLTGSNMAMRKEALEKVAGFDSATNLGADSQISIKLKKHGRVVIDPDNVVSTSARRYSRNWPRTLLMFFKFSINYLWLIVFRRPLFYHFSDVRD